MEPFLVLGDSRRVDAWSVARFQFEGRGWQRDLRDELRRALQRLVDARPDQVLHAVYEAADDGELTDAENVLLYNVGSRYLNHLMTSGVRFERAYSRPDPPVVVLSQPALHRQSYRLAGLEGRFAEWRSGAELTRFEDIDLDKIDKPGPIWAALRHQAEPPPAVGELCRFTLTIRIAGPAARQGGRRSVAELVKPLLDGVICAYHCHTGQSSEEVGGRLAAAGLGEFAQVHAALSDPAWAILGARRLVKPFGLVGVQWNPADDYCVAAEVILDPEPTTAGRWRVSGQLCTALPGLSVVSSM